jgi:GNAT superfamily N-acetyltransferase
MSLISVIENTFFSNYRYWGNLNDSFRDFGSIRSMKTGIDSADMNAVWSEKPLSEEDVPSIRQISNDYESEALPFWWWIFPCAKTAETIKLLEAADCSFMLSMPCLLADLNRLPDNPPGKEPVAVRCVGSKEDLALWKDISFAGFDFPLHTCTQFDRFTASFDLGADSPQKNFLAFVNGKPVATCLLFLTGEAAGIYFVTTLPGHRNKGIGLQLIRETMRRAKTAGARYASLQSSPDGLTVYEKAGFKEYCRVDVYGRNAS